MFAQTMNSKMSLRATPQFARQAPKADARVNRAAVTRAVQDNDNSSYRQGPSEVLLKAFGVAAAAQMAVFPFAGVAQAKQGGVTEPPIESATRTAGDAQKKFLSEGAFNPKEREERNTRNAQGLVQRYDQFKQRISTEGALANNAGGNENVFFPKRKSDGESPLKARDLPVTFPLDYISPAPAVRFASYEQNLAVPFKLTYVGLADPGGAGGASRDREFNYGGEYSEGGPTEGTSDPKKGGDLANSANKFALEFQGEKRQTDTAAFGSGTPNEGGVTNIRESDQKIPNFLGGKGALRDDSIGPEQAAQDNIATAKAGRGSLVDSAKKAFGVE